MRVATWNVQHGRGADGVVDLDRFAAAVASLDADVLALQELDRGQARSGGADLPAVAAQAWGASAWRFAPALAGAPGAWRPARGEADGPAYGVALLSRRPVRSWRAVPLPVLPVRAPRLRRGRPPVLVPDEPRTALVAELDGVAVACAHLTWAPGWGLVQLRRLVRALPPGPAVVLGDLNLGAAGARAGSGLDVLVRAATTPVAAPRRQLDHVLGRGVRGVAARTAALPVSDHRAVLAEISAPSPAGDPRHTA
ncbi:MAG TPA: endonuclease/exonuclease/phosphatase family protein [Mycobacteriales bacterium]|nr:endonuclease/exonuclease/phosphatase family protein [Mycobacteriales bacterium]